MNINPVFLELIFVKTKVKKFNKNETSMTKLLIQTISIKTMRVPSYTLIEK